MKAYHNTAVLKFDDDTTGNAASGAAVTVRINSTQALASIFDVDDVAIGNPLPADSNGNYAFKAADNIYDIIVSEGTANEVKLVKVEISEFLAPEILPTVIPFDTLDLAVNSTDALLVFDGATTKIKNENEMYNDVLSSSVDIDSLYNVQSIGVPSIALVKESKGTIYMQGEGGGIGLQLMQQMNTSKRETFLLVQGDSTGDATNEWVYLTALWFAEQFPRYTVNYYLWNDGTGDYAAPVILEAGRPLTLYLYNGSKPGASSSYFNGNRKPNVYAGRDFDLIIRSYGHNNGAGSALQEIINKEMEGCISIMSDQPQAEIALTLQNVDTDLEAFSATQVKATRIVSQSLGLGIIDVRSAFSWKQITGDLSEWMTDGVHPNSEGQRVWARIVTDALMNPSKQNSLSNTPMLSAQQSPLPNSRFVMWDWNTGGPLDWVPTANVDATRITSPNETMDHCLRLTGNLGTTGFLNSGDLSDYLEQRPKGHGFHFMARVYVAVGNGTSNGGRLEVTTNLGTVTSNARTESFGAFEWRIVYVDESLLDGATSLLTSVYVGNNTDVIYIDRVAIIEGSIPREPTFNANEVFSEYYYDGNVAAKNTNVITVVGDSVTLDSTAEAFPSWFVNVYGLIKGEQYTMEWSSTESVGSVLAREDLGDSGTVLETVNPLSTNKITWRPTKTSGSLQISSGAGLDPFTLSGITIRKGS